MHDFNLKLDNLTIASWPVSESILEETQDSALLVLCKTNEDINSALKSDFVVCGWESDETLNYRYITTDPDDINDEDWPYLYNRCANLPVYILSTERCDIREECLADVDTLIEIYKKPHVTDYLDDLFPRDEELAYIDNYVKYIYEVYGFGIWVVIDKATNAIIGRAGFEIKPDLNEGEAALGYMIDPDFQRKGIAFEVLSAIISYAKTCDINKLIAKIDPENTASIGLAKKLGLTKADEDDETWFILV